VVVLRVNPSQFSPSGKNVRDAVDRCWQTLRAMIVLLPAGASQYFLLLRTGDKSDLK